MSRFHEAALAQSILLLIQTVLSAGFLSAISRFYFEGADRAESKTYTLRGREQTPTLGGAADRVMAPAAGESGPDLAALAKKTAGRPSSALFSLPSITTASFLFWKEKIEARFSLA